MVINVQTKDPKVWGYARVSTDDQDLQLQRDALNRYGVDGIHEEKASGKTMNRDVFRRLWNLYLRRGDTLVVWKLDRLGRTLKDLTEVVEDLGCYGVKLVVLTENIDTSTATGKLFFHFMAAMAEWERNMIAERTSAGMAAARAAGKKFGRRPLIWHDGHGSEKRIQFLRDLNQAGELREVLQDEWVMIPKAIELMVELNKPRNRGKGDKDIVNPETVRRWVRNGWQGLDLEEKSQ